MFFLVCDGLKGLPEVALECVAGDDGPNVCNPFDRQTRFGSRPVSTGMRSSTISDRSFAAPTEAGARAALDDLADRWGKPYPAIIRLWNNAWQEFIPFLDYDTRYSEFCAPPTRLSP